MINYIYQLVSPRVFLAKYDDLDMNKDVVIRPLYMALCHADQRYYTGNRDQAVLKKKLPMALIHECCGEVVYDASGEYPIGQKVVLVPNVPGEHSEEIYENYAQGSGFLSSGLDGFMREYVSMPADRIVPFENIPLEIAAISEFVSVATHAVHRFGAIAHSKREVIGVWGDGSLGFVVSSVLKHRYPDKKIVVVGKTRMKLAQFSFVDEAYMIDELPQDFSVDHAFECAGGEGCASALRSIVASIRPQGTVMMMGVSENDVPINTRDALEKGLTLVGSSRSGVKDMKEAVEILSQRNIQSRFKTIIAEDEPVRSIQDLHRVFQNDQNTPFKTVFQWDI